MKITEKDEKAMLVTDLVNKVLDGPEYQFEYNLLPTERFPFYKGKFLLKFPTIGDELTATRLGAQLRGFVSPMSYSAVQNIIFDAIAWLKVVTVGAPQWFVDTSSGSPEPAPEQMADLEKLMDIYQAWLNWRNSFRATSIEESGGDAS